MFIDALPPSSAPTTTGSYRLNSNSSAINVGNNSVDLDGSGSGIATISSVLKDLDGNTRIVNSIVDLGAYEYNGLDCPSYT